MWTALDYLYRDAGNFKAFGTTAVIGGLSEVDRQEIRNRLDGGEYFIAEQVGLPPLHEELYRWSNGATNSDHCWHEFVGFRDVNEPPDKCLHAIEAKLLVERFRQITEWNGSLS